MSRKIAIILLLVLSMIAKDLKAQTIQLGSGTAEQWEFSSGPIDIYYRRTVCQFVYTAAELSAAGASTINPITDMGLFVTASPVYNIPGYTVKLKHVGVNDVAAALGTTGWTTVKTSFTYAPTPGNWDMLGLDNQTFLWDGVSSIGVEICWSQVAPTWNASGQVRIYATTNGYRYSWTDAGGSSCGSTPNTTSSNKPQMQFVFVAGTSTTWNGSVSTDWFNESNWSAGVPSALMDAIIPSVPSNQPLISGEAIVKDITVNFGATLILAGADTLNVHGDWLLNGSMSGSRSTIIFRGTGATANLMDGVSGQEFNNIEVRSDAGLTLISGTYNVNGSLRLRGGTFTANNLVSLNSTASGTGRLTEIDNLCGYSLVMNDGFGDGWNGGTIRVDIDGETYGTFNAEGSSSTVTINIPNGSDYELVYAAGLYENENSYTFSGATPTVVFSDGPTPAVGSVHSGTGSCTFNNTYIGNLELERYLSLGADGWREMTTGVAGATLADWNDDGLIMSGFTGSDHPSFSFNNAYTYTENLADGDKNNGWEAATNITNSISATAGHKIYVGTGTLTTRISGPPLAGDQSFSLSYQDDAGGADEEGWNLIGNPYACSIDWDSIVIANKVNIDDAIWIWSHTAGNYGVYSGGTGGSGTNGVNADIASSQAFWVHATATSPSLTVSENDKTEADPSFVKSFTHQSNFLVQLTGDANSFYDEAIVTWRDDADNEIDAYDGFKLFSPEPSAPSLSFIPDGVQNLSINVLDATSTHIAMPMQVLVGVTGNYKLEIQNTELLDASMCLILEDLDLDSLIDLQANPEYEFSMSMMNTGTRFVLHTGQWYSGSAWERCDYTPGISADLIAMLIDEKIKADANIYPNPVHDIINLEFLNAEDFQVEKIEVISVNGQVIMEWTDPSFTSLNINLLSQGHYILRVSSDDGQILKKFVKED
jgi:hypothetical protein